MRRVFRLVCCGIVGTVIAGCASQPPESGSPRVRAGSRLAWDQAASSAEEAGTLRFVLMVDEVESAAGLLNTSCGSERGPKGFVCTGALPAIPAGPHTLRVSTRAADGRLSSTPSDPIAVIVE